MDLQTEQGLEKAGKIARIIAGFQDRISEGREDYRQANYAARELQGLDPEDAMIKTSLATNPTFVTARDMMNISEPIYRGKREEMGMGLAKDPMIRTGQLAGTLGNDLVNDSSRGLWWLLNAPQAVAMVGNEYAYSKANPDLFAHDDLGLPVPAMDGTKPRVFKSQEQTAANKKKYDDAVAEGLISKEGVRRKGVGSKDGSFTKRKYDPGSVRALGIPAGIAINAGVGLLNPLGGSGGYSAVLQSDDDPTKTSNVVGEIAAKYILGKTGNLLPYDEFKKVRPDVSPDEYGRYKAFKYKKDGDYNIFDDGQVTLPTGVLKATTDGIHGPEVQFLGRSLPLTTTILPALTAIAGTAAGVRRSRGAAPGQRTAIRDGIIGGMGGLAAGSAAGLVTEELRRRAGDESASLLEGQS